MKNIVIVGAGGFGREVLMLIDDINRDTSVYNVLGFFDDSKKEGSKINGFPVLGKIEDLEKRREETAVVFGIGNPSLKRALAEKLIKNPSLNFPSLIHPSVSIGHPHVELGKGVILCTNVILTVNIVIGDFVTLNLGCTVGHDSVLGNYSAFMPGCDIAGEVTIGSEVYGGMGSKIINQTKIGDGVVLGAGAVVVRDIEKKTLAVGMPAKSIKKL